MAISYGRTDIETPIHADIKETIMVSLSVIWLILLARNQDYKKKCVMILRLQECYMILEK